MKQPLLHIIKRRRGWYWRLVAVNGRVIAIGGEPFASERNALRAFKTAKVAIIRFGFYGIERKPRQRSK